MLICTKRWKEPEDKYSRFLVFDTDDGVEEECSLQDIKNAYSQGYEILGIVYNDNGSISIDPKLMTYSEEYRYHNGENLHIAVRTIKVHTEDNGVILIECADTVNENYKRFGIIYNNKLLGFDRSVPRKDPRHKLGYIDLSYCYSDIVDGKLLLSLSYCYYDKHYYREDAGEYFSKYHLFWGSQTVSETDWLKGSLDSRLPDNISNKKFVWCNKEVNLNIWK